MKRRGRPLITDKPLQQACTSLPCETYDHCDKSAREANKPLSDILRTTLQAAKDAYDIMPYVQQLIRDRDEAIAIARDAIAYAEGAIAILKEYKVEDTEDTHSRYFRFPIRFPTN